MTIWQNVEIDANYSYLILAYM